MTPHDFRTNASRAMEAIALFVAAFFLWAALVPDLGW